MHPQQALEAVMVPVRGAKETLALPEIGSGSYPWRLCFEITVENRLHKSNYSSMECFPGICQ